MDSKAQPAVKVPKDHAVSAVFCIQRVFLLHPGAVNSVFRIGSAQCIAVRSKAGPEHGKPAAGKSVQEGAVSHQSVRTAVHRPCPGRIRSAEQGHRFSHCRCQLPVQLHQFHGSVPDLKPLMGKNGVIFPVFFKKGPIQTVPVPGRIGPVRNGSIGPPGAVCPKDLGSPVGAFPIEAGKHIIAPGDSVNLRRPEIFVCPEVFRRLKRGEGALIIPKVTGVVAVEAHPVLPRIGGRGAKQVVPFSLPEKEGIPDPDFLSSFQACFSTAVRTISALE